MTVDAPSRLTIRVHEADPAVDPLRFALADGPGPSFFWEQPDRDFAVGGRGVAHEIVVAGGPARFREASEGLAELRAHVRVEGTVEDGLEPRLFGGFSFFDDSTWVGFPAGRLLLPAQTLIRMGDRAAWIVAGSGISEIELTASPDATMASPQPRSRYLELVDAAVRTIAAGDLEKVVVARSRLLENAPAPIQLLSELRSHYPTCATFLFQAAGRSFLGASPETLVELNGQTLTTAAVAGTTARVQNPAEDQALADRLASDPKELMEHRFVVDQIASDLAGAGFTAEIDARRVVALENVQHLVTPIIAQVPPEADLLELTGLLHPTPAVGGVPAADAVDFIEDHEHLERGWYSGPVGVFDLHGRGEFRVALRCAMLEGDGATLFAGAGVVADSDPAQELAETDLKLDALARICT